MSVLKLNSDSVLNRNSGLNAVNKLLCEIMYSPSI